MRTIQNDEQTKRKTKSNKQKKKQQGKTKRPTTTHFKQID